MDPGAARAKEVDDLPPRRGESDPVRGGTFSPYTSRANGGWGVTDDGIAKALAQHGIPVVGLNSLHYFWRARTPEETAADVARVVRCYLRAWGSEKVVLIGYSFGADVLPFVVERLPPDLRRRVRLIVFLGLGHDASFQFHLRNWLGGESGDYPVAPEVARIHDIRMLCFYGEDDRSALCPSLDPSLVATRKLPGGHVIGNRYGPIVDQILEALR